MPIPESLILYERDDDGVPFATEEVHAEEWDPSFAARPDPATADVRVFHLARGPLSPAVPPWLSVTFSSASSQRVAEREGSLCRRRGAHGGGTSQRLWPRSPHYRRPRAPLDEFLRAGATALWHPEPPPIEVSRQAEALAGFARGYPALSPLVAEHTTPLERWLHIMFREPERFAEAILLARVEVIAPADAAMLRFLREAHVPPYRRDIADLAIDRAVLLEQASPWRDVEGGSMAAALAAVGSWQRRYARNYGVALPRGDHGARAPAARCRWNDRAV